MQLQKEVPRRQQLAVITLMFTNAAVCQLAPCLGGGFSPPDNRDSESYWLSLLGRIAMKTFLKTFLRDESGASAAEYALILAIIGVGMAGAALLLSLQIQGAMEDAASEIQSGRDM